MNTAVKNRTPNPLEERLKRAQEAETRTLSPLEDRLITAQEACRFLGIGRTTFHRRSLEPQFPRGYKLCKGKTGAKRYRLSEINAWIEKQADAGGEA